MKNLWWPSNHGSTRKKKSSSKKSSSTAIINTEDTDLVMHVNMYLVSVKYQIVSLSGLALEKLRLSAAINRILLMPSKLLMKSLSTMLRIFATKSCVYCWSTASF